MTLKDFFLFCSGANASILKRTPIDVNKYVGMGATIFFTGVFAALAAGYALYTVFESYWAAAILAIFWGLMIFNLDRYIVSTMKKSDSGFRNFTAAAPRIVLALLIAVVIAKPLELKIFESEIESELVLIEQEKYSKQDQLLRSRYVGQIDTMKNEIATWKGEINKKTIERDLLISEAIAEADGTGGSGQKNLGPIYKTKKAAADKADAELAVLAARNNELVAKRQGDIDATTSLMNGEIDALKRVSMSGFAARLEGLERATAKSPAIYWASIFVMLLFMAIELAPILTKLMLDKSPYDMVLEEHELKYMLRNDVQNQIVQNAIKQKKAFDQATHEHKLKSAIEAEKVISDAIIKERLEKLKKAPHLWQDFITRSNILDV